MLIPVRAMRRITTATPAALTVVLLACALLQAHGAAGGKKPPATAARREDVPFIRCEVCQRVAREIHAQVEKKQAEISPKKVSEFEIIEIAENVCNLKKQEADWMLQIDIVEKGDRLELVNQGVEGHCNSECKTIERACQEVMGYADTDIAEFIYKSKPSVDKLTLHLCNKLSDSCSKPTPPVPKSRVPGEAFVPKPSKDAEMEKILRSMDGLPGAENMKMYSREDLMNNNFGGNEDEDDEDDEEDNFQKTLGKVIRDKESSNEDLKSRVLQKITQTGKHLKQAGKHLKQRADKASKAIKKWWHDWNKPSTAPKAGQKEL